MGRYPEERKQAVVERERDRVAARAGWDLWQGWQGWQGCQDVQNIP